METYSIRIYSRYRRGVSRMLHEEKFPLFFDADDFSDAETIANEICQERKKAISQLKAVCYVKVRFSNIRRTNLETF